MRPLDIARALRHDLKYAGFTIQNIDLSAPLEAWAAQSLYRDLFETRRGRGVFALVKEAADGLGDRFSEEISTLLAAAEALEPFRKPLHQGEAVDLSALSSAVKALLVAADALLAATKEAP